MFVAARNRHGYSSIISLAKLDQAEFAIIGNPVICVLTLELLRSLCDCWRAPTSTICCWYFALAENLSAMSLTAIPLERLQSGVMFNVLTRPSPVA